MSEDNRQPVEIELGDIVFVQVFGQPAAAGVLAIIGDEMLVEYVCGSYTALRVVPVSDPLTSDYRTISYTACPRTWLEAMVDNWVHWVGLPKGHTEFLPQPDEMLKNLGISQELSE
jgi:hypothetical protein